MTRGVVAGLLIGALACGGREDATPTIVVHSPEGSRRSFPRYSPDGSRVAWWEPMEEEGARWRLRMADADWNNPVSLPVTSMTPGLPTIWSPDGARIALTSSIRGLASAVVIPSTGATPEDLVWLAPEAAISIPVAWHPDGDRVVYYATAEGGTLTTFTRSLSTGETKPLIPGETRPVVGGWSPDGSRIAFSVTDGARSTIWVADGDGSNQRALTDEGFESLPFSTGDFGWSPDGREIVYESRRTGTSDLWIVSVDSGAPRQLTRDVRNDHSPAWSPDGGSIAFLSDRGRQTDIWVVSRADGTERRVTDTEADEIMLGWQPGSHTVVSVVRNLRATVWAHSLDDGNERPLTPDSLRVTEFNVSDDGRQLAYAVHRGGGIRDLLVAPLDGSEPPRTLIAGGGNVRAPRWSPDGSRLAFGSDRGGSFDIWVIDVASGTLRQLVDWPGYEYVGAWNADGSAIYFVSDRDSRLADLWLAPLSGAEPARITRDGSVGSVSGSRDRQEVFVDIISEESGRLAHARVLPGGELSTVWDASNSVVALPSPSGESVAILAERTDGAGMHVILVGTPGIGRAGGPPRPILEQPVAFPQAWSPDGTRLLYQTVNSAQGDLWVYTLATGESQLLRATPENEGDAEWLSDGRTIVFTRSQNEERIITSDLTGLLGGRPR